MTTRLLQCKVRAIFGLLSIKLCQFSSKSSNLGDTKFKIKYDLHNTLPDLTVYFSHVQYCIYVYVCNSEMNEVSFTPPVGGIGEIL